MVSVERKDAAVALLGFVSKNRAILGEEGAAVLSARATMLHRHREVLNHYAQHEWVSGRRAAEHPAAIMGPALAATDSAIPALEGSACRLLPVALHHMLHAVFQMILEQPASIERNLLLLVLPKLVWNSSFRAVGSMRGHRRRQCIEKRFLMALKGDWQRLVHDFLHHCPNLALPTTDQDEQQQGKMLQRAAQKGCTAKAWRILKGHGLG